MKEFTYTPRGVCSMQIKFQIDEQGILHNVRFMGGCPGNTVGVATMVEGQPAAEVMKKLQGINCSGRGTSCPDQLARALEDALNA